MSPQNFEWAEAMFRYLTYTWGYALVGIVLAVLIRSLVGAIVAFFVLPSIEGIITPMLKENAKYLPFRSLDSIPSVKDPGSVITTGGQSLDNMAALGLFTAYIAVFGILAAVLFIRRDAN